MKNLKISTRIMLGFVSIIVLMQIAVVTVYVKSGSEGSIFIVLGVLAISIIIAIIFSIVITNSITKPLKFISTYVGEIAKTGDLSLVKENSDEVSKYSTIKDESGEIIRALNSLFELYLYQSSILGEIADKDISAVLKLHSEKCTIGVIASSILDQLNDVFDNMRSSSEQVSNGAKQIADGAQDLAQGSTEQAAAVDELSANISRVASITKDNTTMAQKASQLGASIKNNAEKSNHQMDSMMQAVKEINEASQSIGKVIKVIDDIAFQTNILALNAAVEAARAGAHGKGFAVVAEEVRNLAAKSAEAAKDTGELINNSIEKAQLGAKIAQETAASLEEIVNGINESGEIVDKIAEYSEEQYSSINQISTGVNQVAQVVQQNSAASEESAAAAQEMSSQAYVLLDLATQFKLRSGSSKIRSKVSVSSKKQIKSSTISLEDNFGKY